METFYLPDLGEGLPDAIIVEWHVKVGEEVKMDQTLVTLESAKSTVDIPASFNGKIMKLCGKIDETIPTGSPLIEYENHEVSQEKMGIVGQIGASSHTRLASESPTATSSEKRLSLADRARARQGPLAQNLSDARLAMAKNLKRSQEEVLPVTCGHQACIDSWGSGVDLTAKAIEAIAKACSAEPLLNAHFNRKELTYTLNSHVNVGLAMDFPHGLYVPVIQKAQTLSQAEIRAKINTFKEKGKEKKFTPSDLDQPTILLSNFGPLGTTFATPVVVPPMVAIVGIGKVKEELHLENNVPVVKRFLPIVLTSNHLLITGGEASRFLQALIKNLETNGDSHV